MAAELLKFRRAHKEPGLVSCSVILAAVDKDPGNVEGMIAAFDACDLSENQ